MAELAWEKRMEFCDDVDQSLSLCRIRVVVEGHNQRVSLPSDRGGVDSSLNRTGNTPPGPGAKMVRLRV